MKFVRCRKEYGTNKEKEIAGEKLADDIGKGRLAQSSNLSLKETSRGLNAEARWLFGFLRREFSWRHVSTFDRAGKFDLVAGNFSFVDDLE